MVSALLVEHGLSVGTYTSPHLERVNERLAWNLESISDEAFAQVIDEVATLEPLLEAPPSYFELLTAAAFGWFAEIAVDVAVIEVGLLGRFDATNVADATVAVITNIGRDHTDGAGRLANGDRVREGGHRQAGVDAGARPAQSRPASAVRGGRAGRDHRDRGATSSRPRAGGVRRPSLRTCEHHATPTTTCTCRCTGRTRPTNAATALAATEAFFGRALDHDTVSQAFASVSVPGRFEVVHRNPLVILDGAHNVDGRGAHRRHAVRANSTSPGRLVLVIGLLRGRDPREMLDALRADRARPGDRLHARLAPRRPGRGARRRGPLDPRRDRGRERRRRRRAAGSCHRDRGGRGARQRLPVRRGAARAALRDLIDLAVTADPDPDELA